jgi:23S rRNA pseudouridine2605 synthase
MSDLIENEVRLQKYMAKAGIASRRKAEEIILQKRVSINGRVVNSLGIKVRKKDIVTVDGKLINIQEKMVYIMLNKPDGYITTSSDQFGRNDVLSLINGVEERVFPVGRLDYSSTGLLLLTNDGDLTYKLTHPKHDVEKKYLVKIKGVVTEENLLKLKKPIIIDNYQTKPAEVSLFRIRDDSTLVFFTIKEGRNRQVRRLCESIGLEIVKLKRISIGKLELGDLKKKMWRYLDEKEIEYLKKV